MPNRSFIYLDEIFDGLSDAFDELNGGFSSVQRKTNGYARVTKNTTSVNNNKKKETPEQIPYVSSNTNGLTFKSRYDAFNAYVDNIVYGRYDNEKKDGFDTAIKHYKEMLNQNRDFKHLEKQIVNDIKECGKNLATDKYLSGYYQGLLVLKNIISQSKKTCFGQFANKFN